MIKKKTFQSNKGFTLVEMMIVIAIIGLLAFLAMTSLGSANRSAKLDIAVDTLVSVIKQQQGLAKSGSIDNSVLSASSDSQGVYCYGVRFTAAAGFTKVYALKSDQSQAQAQVKLIKVPYVRVDDNAADYCREVTDTNLADYSLATDINVNSINWMGTAEKQIDIMFKPPFALASVIEPAGASGSVILKLHDKSSSALTSLELVKNKDLQIIIQSSVSEEMQRIIFSPEGGTVHKTIVQP